MEIYGVEEQFWVDGYQFEVSFSDDNAVGLCQRDIWVAHRRKVEDLALADFTGPQLLEAYVGPDADQRKVAFAQRREALRASYKEARRAPHAQSERLLRQEKKDLKRLEKALALELCAQDSCLFDLTRVQDQVQQTKHHRFLRSFYFHEVNDRYIHHFCRKYATDAAYRAAVENGTALWVERNALFLKNVERRAREQTVGQLPPNERGVLHLQALCEEQFFQWICQHAKSIFADLAYQRLKQQEQASEAACESGIVDPEMQEVVTAWYTLPGVFVRSACQGGSFVFTSGGKTLLVPSRHQECATLLVVPESRAVIEAICRGVSAFPHICLTQFARPVGSFREGSSTHCQMQSPRVLSNAQVRRDLLRAVSLVKAELLA
jgi:hypothetical protein